MENKKIIKKCKKLKLMFISLFLVLLTMNLVNAYFYYDIKVYYDRGKIEIKNVDVIYSQDNIENNGNYVLEVRENNKVLNYSFFSVPNIMMYDEGDENGNIISGGKIVLENVSFSVKVPYNENADELKVYDSNKTELAKKDISAFSKSKVVSDIEILKKNVDENNAEKTQTSIDKISKNYPVIIISLIILLLIVIIIIVLVFRKRKKKR